IGSINIHTFINIILPQKELQKNFKYKYEVKDEKLYLKVFNDKFNTKNGKAECLAMSELGKMLETSMEKYRECDSKLKEELIQKKYMELVQDSKIGCNIHIDNNWQVKYKICECMGCLLDVHFPKHANYSHCKNLDKKRFTYFCIDEINKEFGRIILDLYKIKNTNSSVQLENKINLDDFDIGIQSMRVGHYILIGQSIAGCRTCIAIPKLNICLDMGIYTDISIRQKYVLISHGHADHIGCLHMHAFNRRLLRMENPIYFMPQECVDGFNLAHKAYKTLNRNVLSNIDHNWLTQQYQICTEERKELGNLIIGSFKTVHPVPSQGYVIYEKRSRLKEAYKQLSEKEIGTIRKSGEQVTQASETPIIAFTGDTTIKGVLQNPEFLQAEILIIECTYLNVNKKGKGLTSPSLASQRGHIHEQDLIQNQEKFKNKFIVVTHISRRHTSQEIQKSLERLQAVFNSRKIYIFDPRS
ncbi:MAG TPA: hypothetical protein VN704_07030, partial [Verrucomicrobiae bacterium]|nr:hypothetical protein [Verrucomicrobiae bacterium]